MDSDAEMPMSSDEEMLDDEDYYDYSDDMGEDDDGSGGGGGGDSDGEEEEEGDEELVGGDYEGREAEGSDEVVSRREQVRIFWSEADQVVDWWWCFFFSFFFFLAGSATVDFIKILGKKSFHTTRDYTPLRCSLAGRQGELNVDQDLEDQGC